MMRDFLNANVFSMFAIGLLLACVVGTAEGFRQARNMNSVFSYRKALSQATFIIVFYLIFGGGGLYLALRLQNGVVAQIDAAQAVGLLHESAT